MAVFPSQVRNSDVSAKRSRGHSICYLMLCKVATFHFAVVIALLNHTWDSGSKKDMHCWCPENRKKKIHSFLYRDRTYLQTRTYIIKFQKNELFSEGPGKGDLNNKKERVKAQNSLRATASGGKQVSGMFTDRKYTRELPLPWDAIRAVILFKTKDWSPASWYLNQFEKKKITRFIKEKQIQGKE